MPSSFTTNKALEEPARGDDVGTWDIPINANMTLLDTVLGGAQAVTINAADVTLTQTEANHLSFVLTGVLTGNRNLKFPAIGGFFAINNQTTGSFTVTVKTTAGGSTGYVAPQGISSTCYLDGTNAYNLSNIPVTNALLNTMAASTVKANVTAGIATPTDVTLAAFVDLLIPIFNTKGIGGAGQVAYFPGTAPSTGWYELNGVLLNRTTDAALWAYAQTSGNIIAEASWSPSNIGCFTTGDLATTFRIPLAAGLFIRGWDHGAGFDPGRPIGSYEADTFQTHGHTASSSSSVSGGTIGGVGFANFTGGSSGTAVTGPTNVIVSTSTSVGAPNSGSPGTETRGKNIAWLPCICRGLV